MVYQQNSALINGCHSVNLRAGDHCEEVQADHESIDNNDRVLRDIIRFITQ